MSGPDQKTDDDQGTSPNGIGPTMRPVSDKGAGRFDDAGDGHCFGQSPTDYYEY